jgi:Tol biopolymer transport system component
MRNGGASLRPLSVGKRLGRYRIQRALGSGGMGYVYEAMDEDLNRVVAVKVLPVGRYDETSRKRFRWEAEAASALNHPNIVTVHEVGRDGEIDFIAMERVSGQTLHRIAGGRPMPAGQAIRIAVQIADALAAAHEAGIVHRDLKPSNVMVSDRGVVKVLDFGLAKHVFGDAAGDSSRLGEIVGTVYYMSPEQAEGKPVDARSDIFAFGSVLYELLTAKRPFKRETDLATLTAIVNAEPEPLLRLRPDVPRLLESIIRKCLRKHAYERWQSLSDVKLILQDLAADADTTTREGGVALAPQTRTNTRTWIPYAVAVATAGALLTVALQRALRPATAAPAVLPIVRMVTAEKGLSTSPALSHDGALLAFASDRAGQGNLDIWIQHIGGSEPLRLTSDPGDETDPSFSPDGARVAFRSEKGDGGIYIVPALGGDPVLIASRGRSPRFSPDGKSIAYWEGREGSLIPGLSKAFILDLAGVAPRQLETGLAWVQHPVWSPDGSSLMVYGMPNVAMSLSAVDWWIVPAVGGKAKPVGIRNTLPFLKTIRSLPVVLDWYSGEQGPQVLFAPNGGDNTNLWSIGMTAAGELGGPRGSVTSGPGRQASASLTTTKEGWTRLAFADETANYDVWRLPVHAGTGLADGPLQAVTDRLTPETNPSISGDGKQAYFITTRLGTWSIIRKDLDSNRQRVLYSAPEYFYNTRVASEGSKVFFTKRQNYELLAIPAAGGMMEKVCAQCGSLTGVSPRGDRMLLEPNEDEHLLMFDTATGKLIKLADRGDAHLMLSGGQFSPDGRWVAFSATNNQTQKSAVYVIPISGPLPVPSEQWIQIASDSELSRDPIFAPAGPYLYFTAETDGFRCLWGRRLHPATQAPVGDAFPVQHFHSSRLALRTRAGSGNIIGLSAGGRHLMFALTETTGNVWLEETKRVE